MSQAFHHPLVRAQHCPVGRSGRQIASRPRRSRSIYFKRHLTPTRSCTNKDRGHRLLRPQWCCACTSTAEVAEAHPCWQHRSLQCFGGELLELRFTGGSAWRKLYGRLALAINHLRLGKPTLREGLRFETSAAAWDLELQLGVLSRADFCELGVLSRVGGLACKDVR